MGKVGDPDLGLGCSAGQGCSAYQLTQVQTFTAPAQRRELILAAPEWEPTPCSLCAPPGI